MKTLILLHGKQGTFKSTIVRHLERSIEVTTIKELVDTLINDSECTDIVFSVNDEFVLATFCNRLKNLAKKHNRQFIHLKSV